MKMEKYLDLPPYLRVPTTRLRTSAHSLRIETGRYNLPTAILADKHICGHCTSQLVEDELHFLFDCDLYKLMEERAKLMDHCKSLNPSLLFLSWLIWTDGNSSYLYHSRKGTTLPLLQVCRISFWTQKRNFMTTCLLTHNYINNVMFMQSFCAL